MVSARARIRAAARGDLVVDVEVDDAGRHRQTFIARRTRRSAASSGSSVDLELDRLVGEAQRRDVLLVDEQVRRVRDRLDLVGRHDRDFRRPRERQTLPEPLGRRARADLGQARAAAAQVDPARQEVAAGELLHDQLHAGRPDRDVVGDDLATSSRRSTGETAGVVDLERLGPRERQLQPIGERLGERPAAEGEHPRALDAALADERDVGRPAADVDEQRPGLLDLLAAEHAGDRVRLGDDLEQLQVELAGDGLRARQVDQRRERVEDPDPDVAALEPDRVRDRVAVDRGAESTAAWTSRTSTLGRPVSQVIDRSASRSASRWTASMSFWSSASVIGWSGCLRSWLCVVVKPLTSSPAMPMTTWLGRKPAISSASWRATAQLSTTAAMSATVPDCMWRQALALAADAADRPVPVVVDLEDERLGELRADIERRAGGQRLVVVALPDAAPEGHQPDPFVGPTRRGDRLERGRQPVAPGALALGHLGAAAALAVDEPRHSADELAGGDPARRRGRR